MALRSRLPLIIGELEPKLEEAMLEFAEEVVIEAQARVPVDEGDLRDAIHVEETEEGISIVAGDDVAYYGHIIENGSVKRPATPFLVPAYEAKRPNLPKIAEEKLEDL